MISDFEPCIFVFCKSRMAQNTDVRQMMNSFFPCSSVEYLKRHKRHNPFTMRHCLFTLPYTDSKIKDSTGSEHMNRSQKSKAYGEWIVSNVSSILNNCACFINVGFTNDYNHVQGRRCVLCVGLSAGDIISTHGGVCGSETGMLMTGVPNMFVAEINNKQIQAGIKNMQSMQVTINGMFTRDIRAPMSCMLVHKDDEARMLDLEDDKVRWLPCQECLEPAPAGAQAKFDSLFGGMDHLRVS